MRRPVACLVMGRPCVLPGRWWHAISCGARFGSAWRFSRYCVRAGWKGCRPWYRGDAGAPPGIVPRVSQIAKTWAYRDNMATTSPLIAFPAACCPLMAPSCRLAAWPASCCPGGAAARPVAVLMAARGRCCAAFARQYARAGCPGAGRRAPGGAGSHGGGSQGAQAGSVDFSTLPRWQ